MPDSVLGLIETRLSVQRVSNRKADEMWRHWAKPFVRRGTVHLLAECLLTPCAIRARTSADVLLAAGVLPRQICSEETARILAVSLSDGSCPALTERCLWLLGYLRSQAAIEPLERSMKSLPVSLLSPAIVAAGNVAARFRSESVGLLAWAEARAKSALSDSVAGAWAYAMTASGHLWQDPTEVTSPYRKRLADWSRETLSDPLLPASLNE